MELMMVTTEEHKANREAGIRYQTYYRDRKADGNAFIPVNDNMILIAPLVLAWNQKYYSDGNNLYKTSAELLAALKLTRRAA